MAPRAAFARTSRQNGAAASQTQCCRRLAECEVALAEAQSIIQVTQAALYQSNNEVAKLQAALSNSDVLIRDLRRGNAVHCRDLSICQARLRQRTQRAAEAEAVLGDYVKALVACQTKLLVAEKLREAQDSPPIQSPRCPAEFPESDEEVEEAPATDVPAAEVQEPPVVEEEGFQALTQSVETTQAPDGLLEVPAQPAATEGEQTHDSPLPPSTLNLAPSQACEHAATEQPGLDQSPPRAPTTAALPPSSRLLESSPECEPRTAARPGSAGLCTSPEQHIAAEELPFSLGLHDAAQHPPAADQLSTTLGLCAAPEQHIAAEELPFSLGLYDAAQHPPAAVQLFTTLGLCAAPEQHIAAAELPPSLGLCAPAVHEEASAELPDTLSLSPSSMGHSAAHELPSTLGLCASTQRQPAAASLSLPGCSDIPTRPAPSLPSYEGQEEDLHGENDNLRFNLHNANLQKELAQADRERLAKENAQLKADHDRRKGMLANTQQLPVLPPCAQSGVEWRHVAKGGYGAVKRGCLPVAMKMALAGQQDVLIYEAKAMMRMNHPHILRPLVLLEDEEGLQGMVMEWFGKGDLHTISRRGTDRATLPLQQQLHYIVQACDGMIHANGMGIFNYDIKPENVFIRKDDSIVMGDWGLAVYCEKPVSFRGTVGYTMPEAIDPAHKVTGGDMDAYAIAAVGASLLSGKHRFFQLKALYEQLPESEVTRVREALRKAGHILTCEHRQFAMAQYMGFITLAVQSPRQLPPCADKWIQHMTAALAPVKDPASRSSFSLEHTRRIAMECLAELQKDGKEGWRGLYKAKAAAPAPTAAPAAAAAPAADAISVATLPQGILGSLCRLVG